MIEMKKMALCDLEIVCRSAELTKQDVDWIWPPQRVPLGIF